MKNLLPGRRRNEDTELEKQARANSLFLDTAFYVFTALYLPTAVLFWSSGNLLRFVFALYSIFVLLLALMMIMKFFVAVAKDMNAGESPALGLLVYKGIVGLVLPILVMKVVGWLMIAAAPPRHGGLVCDFFSVIKNIYRALDFNNLTTVLFYGAVAALVYLILRSVQPKR